MGVEATVDDSLNTANNTDGYAKEQKEIDDWLPIKSSRNAKWWYSAFHNVTAMVGAGVLSLPYAMANLGCYSTIAWTASIHKGVQPEVEYGYKSSSRSQTVFNFFNALGDVAFAYAGHNVVLEIQATIPSTPEKPSKRSMWRGVVVADIVVALCYFPVALVGYYVFGNNVEDNILISLEKPEWLIVAANLFVVVHVIGSYQIYAMPVFDMIETLMVKKLHFRPSGFLRFIVSNVYVAPLHHVACHLQTKKVKLILVYQLDLHYTGRPADGSCTYWRAKKHHRSSQELHLLLLRPTPTLQEKRSLLLLNQIKFVITILLMFVLSISEMYLCSTRYK